MEFFTSSHSYVGDAIFSSQLKELGCSLDINETKAFIMGSILCEENIMPMRVLEGMWSMKIGSKNQGPQYKNFEEAQSFIRNFTGLWNHLASFQDSPVPFKFSTLPENIHTNDELENIIKQRLKEYCLFLEAYTCGFEFGGVEDYDATNPSTFPYPVILDALIEVTEKQLEKIYKKRTLDPSQELEILRAGDRKLEAAFPRLVHFSRAVRMGFVEDIPEDKTKKPRRKKRH